jgi:hypothetical protein
LAIESVEVQDAKGVTLMKVVNDPYTPKFTDFQKTLFNLVRAGITVEQVEKMMPISAPMDAEAVNRNLQGIATATAVPSTWACAAAWYDALDGCDCECSKSYRGTTQSGATNVDPDCLVEDQTVYGCSNGQTCSAKGKCKGGAHLPVGLGAQAGVAQGVRARHQLAHIELANHVLVQLACAGTGPK